MAANTRQRDYDRALAIYEEVWTHECRHKRASVRRKRLEEISPEERMDVEFMYDRISAERKAGRPKNPWMQDFVMKGSISSGSNTKA